MSDAAVLLACLRMLLEWMVLVYVRSVVLFEMECCKFEIGLYWADWLCACLYCLRLDWIGLLGFDCVLAVGVLYPCRRNQ